MTIKSISLSVFILLSGLASVCVAEQLQSLPTPVTNNAVTAVRVQGQTLVYSLMGLGPEKAWNSVTTTVNAFNVKYNKWTTVRAVPGAGRLGASAESAREQIFVVGGYIPDSSGRQAIVGDVSVYDPVGLRWYRGPDLLTPVRDAVTGVYRDRYIYVIGGFSRQGPTNEVQVYDVEQQRWQKATPSPGAPVFGHAGTVVDDNIIYVDGARRDGEGAKVTYAASDECWVGKIDHHHPEKITWSKVPPHPGEARYRIAAGGSDKDDRGYFAGGSASVYDFNGIGMDGKPAEPSETVFAFNFKKNAWEALAARNVTPTMDHRGLVVTPDGLIIVGGMGAGQKVSAGVLLIPKGK